MECHCNKFNKFQFYNKILDILRSSSQASFSLALISYGIFIATIAVGGPPKSTYKSGGPSTASLKAGRTASPLPSPHGKSGTPASPNGYGNIVKNHVNTDEVTPIQVKSKENAPNSEKEIPVRTNSVAWETTGGKGNSGAKPTDLKSLLITLLMENPKGMTLKVSWKEMLKRKFNSRFPLFAVSRFFGLN